MADSLKKQIAECMLRDQKRLFSQLKVIQQSTPQESGSFSRQIKQAIERKQARAAACPVVSFSGDLPIHARLDEIKETIQRQQTVIICGETGSGKTTQLPKLCLSIGRGINGQIGHTQPRRIAARTVATRIADELATPLGAAVGYKIRNTDKTSKKTYIKLMTDGILLAELQHDRLLETYDTLIIDEAHERSLNIDFILGYLKQLLPKRPDLKIIITSATIDVERFSEHFNNAPVIEVSGRIFPVEVRYRPVDDKEVEDDTGDDVALLAAIRELSLESHGDILIFLEGEREIHETSRFLNKQKFPDTDILPLYSRLATAQQIRIFKPHKRRHIVLATNVAETSLTIPGIRYVIDRGFARISRYSRRSKVQQLPVEKISQASSDQRKGRCGRLAAGICIRLYSDEDFAARALYTDAEILRTNLASVILQMKAMELGDINEFPFIDKPDTRYINDGLRLLAELKAIDADKQLTETGRQLARLPVDPRLGCILLAARELACISEVLVIVSALSVQDTRQRPLEAQERADAAHKRFADERSDFLWFLNLWNFYHERARHLSQNQLHKLCRQNYISYMRIREWRDVYKQLSEFLSEMGIRKNTRPADYNTIHCALLSGFLGHVAVKTDDREYTGARGIKLNIFPGSGQFKRLPKWIMAAELTETTRLYARTVANIDPQWLIKPAAHLLQSNYFEPHWNKQAQQVMVYERITLYGLILVPKRKINYGKVDPKEARRIFIQSALVEGNYQTDANFFRFNQNLIEDIRLLEQKLRRLDILNETAIYAFYDQKIPEGICNGPVFKKWYKKAVEKNSGILYLNKEDIMNHPAQSVTPEYYPDLLKINQHELLLTYKFHPGDNDDGITLDIPLRLLNQLNHGHLERLLPPDMMEEKIMAMLKTLPKPIRRNLVPIPDCARECAVGIMINDKPLAVNLAEYLFHKRGLQVPDEFWQSITLPDYLLIKIRVLDDENRIVGEGRDLEQLKEMLSLHAQEQFAALSDPAVNRDGLTQWEFGELPEVINLRFSKLSVQAYPALVDMYESVSVRCFDTAEKARTSMRAGLMRLFILVLKKDINYLNKHLQHIDKMCMHYSSIGTCFELKNDLIELIVEQVFIADNPEIRGKDEFEKRIQNSAQRLLTEANNICALVHELLQKYHDIKTRITGNVLPARSAAIEDIREHIDYLIFSGFIRKTPFKWLKHFPRYLDGINKRLDKLSYSLQKDEKQSAKLKQFWDFYRENANRQSNHLHLELEKYRWMLEEYRVSLYAQELKTVIPVSYERIRKQLDSIKRTTT